MSFPRFTGNIVAFGFSVFLMSDSGADVFDVVVTDVTTRAFSVIWASDEPIGDSSNVTVSVFKDFDRNGSPDGPNIADSLEIQVESSQTALDNGIAKIDVRGVEPARTYLVATTTTTTSGTFLFPLAGSLLSVDTATRTSKTGNAGSVIANDLLIRDVLNSDGTPAATGSILIVATIPEASRYPLSAFVGGNIESPNALIDLNNLIDSTTGTNAQLGPDVVVSLAAYRGLQCPGLEHHILLQHRKLAMTSEPVALTNVTETSRCFAQNINCDDVIDIIDVQLVFDAYLVIDGTCQFNPDLDLNDDGVVDIADAQQIFDRYLETAPFE